MRYVFGLPLFHVKHFKKHKLRIVSRETVVSVLSVFHVKQCDFSEKYCTAY